MRSNRFIVNKLILILMGFYVTVFPALNLLNQEELIHLHLAHHAQELDSHALEDHHHEEESHGHSHRHQHRHGPDGPVHEHAHHPILTLEGSNLALIPSKYILSSLAKKSLLRPQFIQQMADSAFLDSIFRPPIA